MAREVVCTTKDPDGPNDCRCIEKLGVHLTTVDSTITQTPEEVHDKIKDGKSYHVEHNGSKTELLAATRGSTKYVRTKPNDDPDDNLLQIKDC